MQIYKCIVNLCNMEGRVCTEVAKDGVTAPEIIVLRAIHGANNVVKISPTAMDKRSHTEERNRLAAIYGDKKIEELFGPAHNRLPVRLPDVSVLGDEPGEAAA